MPLGMWLRKSMEEDARTVVIDWEKMISMGLKVGVIVVPNVTRTTTMIQMTPMNNLTTTVLLRRGLINMTAFDNAWDLTKIYMRDSKGNPVMASQGGIDGVPRGHIKGSSYPPGPPDLNEYLAQEAERKYMQEDTARETKRMLTGANEQLRAMQMILENYADGIGDSDPEMTLNMLMGVLDMTDYHEPEFMPRRV